MIDTMMEKLSLQLAITAQAVYINNAVRHDFLLDYVHNSPYAHTYFQVASSAQKAT